MIIKGFGILIIVAIFSSCIDKYEEKLTCNVFDYKNGILIFSPLKIDSLVKIIRYEKNNLNKALDTTLIKVRDYTKYEKNKYSVDIPSMNTDFDYQIILNDTLLYFFTDIKTTVSKHGQEFMQGRVEMCDIVGYKLNNISIENKAIRIDSAFQQYVIKKNYLINKQ
jgi:hypothetical protein